MQVYLNVYDITKLNQFSSTLGLAAFHTGIEIDSKI